MAAGIGSVAALAGLVVFRAAAKVGYPVYSPAEAVPVAVAAGLSGGVLLRYPGGRVVGRLLLTCG